MNRTLAIGIALAATDALMITTVSLFAKLLSVHFEAAEVVFLRNIVAITLLTAWLIYHGNLTILKTKRPFAHILRGIIGTTGIILGFASLSIMPIAEASILFLTGPLFIVLLSYPVLRERVGLTETLAVLIGFSGVIVMSNPTSGAQTLPALGILLGLCWGLSSAGVNLCLRWMGSTENSTRSVFYFMLIGLMITGAQLPFTGHPVNIPLPGALWLIAALGATSLIHQLAKAQSLRMVKAATIAPVIYSMIVWAMIYDYIFWDKPPAINTIAGATLIVGANLFLLYRKTRRSKK